MELYIVYQIVAKGEMIGGGCGRYNSKKVYVNKPTDLEINEFTLKCTSSNCHELDLVKESVEITIVELNVLKH